MSTHSQPERLLDAAEFTAVFESWFRMIRDTVTADAERWAIVGIKRRGAVLAERVHERLEAEGVSTLFGEVDISLYRDDYHLQTTSARVLGTEVDFAVDGLKIMLVDDVLYTGRTVRAAMGVLLDLGRPRVIELAVFVDRGNRELPIAANLIGRTITTRRDDHVKVHLAEIDGDDRVELRPESASSAEQE